MPKLIETRNHQNSGQATHRQGSSGSPGSAIQSRAEPRNVTDVAKRLVGPDAEILMGGGAPHPNQDSEMEPVRAKAGPALCAL
ncbi:hypothetical protein HD596_000730 [Nonomuraea jabiensis]|uniref:Uncharacterized protein n=1 Tax=Nonomuraea jabiensis TaxID=882448 RepID=A0A7W9FYL5_9ACTN|nr:hypothetical protein [Nonomuraea jabiensis]